MQLFPHRVDDYQNCIDTQILDEDVDTPYSQGERKMITKLNFELYAM